MRQWGKFFKRYLLDDVETLDDFRRCAAVGSIAGVVLFAAMVIWGAFNGGAA